MMIRIGWLFEGVQRSLSFPFPRAWLVDVWLKLLGRHGCASGWLCAALCCLRVLPVHPSLGLVG